MVDWQSQAELQKNGASFSSLMHTLLGLYIWEWFVSLPFDWQYISGKKKFRWPMIFYFLNRYCLLIAMIGIAVALNVTSEVNCQGLYTFNQCLGNAAIGLASINLSLRTMAVWSQRWYIVIPLVVIILGHWSLLLHGVLVKAVWIPGIGCSIVDTNNKVLAVSFIYSMIFDLVVLSLTGYKLIAPTSGRSRLVELIFNDGLIYFVIAFLANLTATVFMLLNLNAVMSIVANVPAAIASTIVACRVVRRLSNFTSKGPEMFPSSQNSTLAFRPKKLSAKFSTNVSSTMNSQSEGVHVQMETFECTGDKSYIEYDASGAIVKRGTLDPEAQVISSEFKRPPY